MTLRPLTAFLILPFLIRHSALAHPADQSEMLVKPAPHVLEVRFTFNLLTVVKMVRVDTDGDQRLTVAELRAAEPVLTRYLNEHIQLEVNQKPAEWGEKARFDYLWPNFVMTSPMAEIEYAARNMDVTFVMPQKKLLEDFWIGFEIFEQTGSMQTIRGVFEQDGQVLEVPFSFQEPEYTYDTGFADDPFVQEAERQAARPHGAVGWPWFGWLLLAVLVLAAARWRVAKS